jgi:hypothetical protein
MGDGQSAFDSGGSFQGDTYRMSEHRSHPYAAPAAAGARRSANAFVSPEAVREYEALPPRLAVAAPVARVPELGSGLFRHLYPSILQRGRRAARGGDGGGGAERGEWRAAKHLKPAAAELQAPAWPRACLVHSRRRLCPARVPNDAALLCQYSGTLKSLRLVGRERGHKLGTVRSAQAIFDQTATN